MSIGIWVAGMGLCYLSLKLCEKNIGPCRFWCAKAGLTNSVSLII
jgi:hypothetical protein